MATKRKKAKAAAIKTKVFNLGRFKNDIKALKKALKKATKGGKVRLKVKNAPFRAYCA